MPKKHQDYEAYLTEAMKFAARASEKTIRERAAFISDALRMHPLPSDLLINRIGNVIRDYQRESTWLNHPDAHRDPETITIDLLGLTSTLLTTLRLPQNQEYTLEQAQTTIEEFSQRFEKIKRRWEERRPESA